ncbi:30S ribosomal protein S17, partial [Lactobacillus delbrueckii subsp. bulgaricus]|nr:30S ribosomal protein S17 [Lactobacillus delbrueckii subsp. bulgaricus]
YSKRTRYSKKYYAMDENNEAKVGDIVRIMETRPLSRTKRFRLVDIVKKSV